MADLPCELTSARVTSAFRSLADEHATKRRARDREQIWHSVLIQTQAMALRRGAARWSASRPPWGRLHMAWVAVPLAVFLSLGIIGLISWSSSPANLRYELVGGQIRGGTITTADESASLEFSDDSVVELKPKTEVTVSLVGRRSAVTRLSRGRVQARVEHAEDTDWRFFAGPYEVRVVGTEFDLEWQPDSRSLALVMHKGWVRVLGPDNMARVLTAGERLDLRSEPPDRLKVAEKVAEKEGSATGPVREAPPAAENREAARAGAPARTVHRATQRVSLADLVARGHFKEAVGSARSVGIPSVIETYGASELQALAQAASYTGHTSLSLRVWKALRQRFPGKSEGRQAAFFLGRIYEQQGQVLEAMGWLNNYLAEAPGGVFAAEALGRKMHLVRRLQGVAAGRSVAKQYLRRFPQGPYARAARGMLSED